jgi:hypothetical protein
MKRLLTEMEKAEIIEREKGARKKCQSRYARQCPR